MAKTLTAAAVAKLPPDVKRREIPDAGCPGLRLIIQPSGAKSWALRFRRPNGKTAKMTLGPFDNLGEMEGEPVVGQPLTLAAARRVAADIMRQRALGKDVISDHNIAKRRRTLDRDEQTANAFDAAARAFIEQHAKPNTRSWVITAKILGLSPATLEPVKGGLAERWRGKPVGEITGDDIHSVVDEARVVGIPGLGKRRIGASDSMARVSYGRLSRFFAWLMMERRIIKMNPCLGVWRPPVGDARERTLSDQEIRWLWRAAESLGYPFGPALRLLLLTGQRRGEVGGMRWDELSEDQTIWTLPASRAKNSRAHVVPLPQAAQRLIASVPVIGNTFILTTDGRTHAAGWSKVKVRLDRRMMELARAESAVIPPWTIHDIRRTVATGLQRLGVRLEVTEAVLNHQSGSRAGIVAVYQRHQYFDEKRAALDLWAAHVEKIVSDPKTTPGARRALAAGA